MEGNFLTNFSMDIISCQFDQEQKIIDLEQEVSRLKQELLERKAQMVATGHDQNTAKLRQEVEKLKQDLQNSRVREQQLSRKLSSSTGVPSPVLGKIKVIFIKCKITSWTVDLKWQKICEQQLGIPQHPLLLGRVFPLWDLRFPQQCFCRSMSHELWHATLLVFPDIFKAQHFFRMSGNTKWPCDVLEDINPLCLSFLLSHCLLRSGTSWLHSICSVEPNVIE